MRRSVLAIFAILSIFNFQFSICLAQTDVTSQYIKNASFEANNISQLSADNTRGAYVVGNNLTGWTVTGSYGVSDIMTAAATACTTSVMRGATLRHP